MITKEIANQVTKIARGEAERLVRLAEKQYLLDIDGTIADEGRGYIIGVYQLLTNITIMVCDLIDYNGPICWSCGSFLETIDGKDYAGENVQVCTTCNATIRN